MATINKIKVGNTTYDLQANSSSSSSYASSSGYAKSIQEVGTHDLNAFDYTTFLQSHNFNIGTTPWSNGPEGLSYGHVIQFPCTSGGLVTQMAVDSPRSTGDKTTTNNFYVRIGNPAYYKNTSRIDKTITDQNDSWNLSSWKRVAWANELDNYLPLSGGTMTGKIVQGFNDSLIVDSNDNGWFDMNGGFDLYTVDGEEFAYLSYGGLVLSDPTNVISLNSSQATISATYKNNTSQVVMNSNTIPYLGLMNTINSMQHWNYITMQGPYMAVKLSGNELCIGNGLSTSTTNLNINYRSITNCGTFAGFILRAGSSTSLATLQCGAVTAPAFYQTSDIRKKNIIDDLPLDKCIDLVDKCQTVIYTLKDQTKEQIGMIAQEVEEFFPEVISTDEEGYKSLDYSRLVVVCLKVLKDLMKRVSDLERR